ncbi:MAG: hypothetical protein M1305_02990 [Candidatus Marsarchaeota archaeon]|nr:hypothetical protein [Candidatus Marsarchaeota archaeon]
MTQTHPAMRDIYERLKLIGFTAAFVRSCILPEWWEDKLADVPSNRQYVSWNEFQQINKGSNRERVSQVYRATPWFKAPRTQTQVRFPVALTHVLC